VVSPCAVPRIRAALESTGIYWKPIWYLFEDLFALL
jgi:hypothetical protein